MHFGLAPRGSVIATHLANTAGVFANRGDCRKRRSRTASPASPEPLVRRSASRLHLDRVRPSLTARFALVSSQTYARSQSMPQARATHAIRLNEKNEIHGSHSTSANCARAEDTNHSATVHTPDSVAGGTASWHRSTTFDSSCRCTGNACAGVRQRALQQSDPRSGTSARSRRARRPVLRSNME